MWSLNPDILFDDKKIKQSTYLVPHLNIPDTTKNY